MSILNPGQTSPPQFTSLPREIRDRIYGELVLSNEYIYVKDNEERSGVYLDLRHESFQTGGSLEPFFEAVSGSAIASEVYQEFFRINRFHMHPHMLPAFLNGLPTALRGQQRIGLPAWKENLDFNKLPWLRSLKVSDNCLTPDVFTVKNLALISQLPCLKTLEYGIFPLSTPIGRPTTVFHTIEHIASTISSIRKQIAGGLTVKFRGHWTSVLSYNGNYDDYFGNEDITWMWDEPTEEMKRKVENGLGSHRDCIKVLMSTGFADEEGTIGRWADHWLEDHGLR